MIEAGHGDIPNEATADTDFCTVMGNLVYLGNDHGSGAAFMPHTMTPDTTAPKVAKIYPSNGDMKQPLTTRITVFFSDDIDLGTVNTKNLIVRKNGCARGRRSVQQVLVQRGLVRRQAAARGQRHVRSGRPRGRPEGSGRQPIAGA